MLYGTYSKRVIRERKYLTQLRRGEGLEPFSKPFPVRPHSEPQASCRYPPRPSPRYPRAPVQLPPSAILQGLELEAEVELEAEAEAEVELEAEAVHSLQPAG